MENLFKKLLVEGYYNKQLREYPKSIGSWKRDMKGIDSLVVFKPGNILETVSKLYDMLPEEGREELQEWWNSKLFTLYYYITNSMWIPKNLKVSPISNKMWNIASHITIEIYFFNDWADVLLSKRELVSLCDKYNIGLFSEDQPGRNFIADAKKGVPIKSAHLLTFELKRL